MQIANDIKKPYCYMQLINWDKFLSSAENPLDNMSSREAVLRQIISPMDSWKQSIGFVETIQVEYFIFFPKISQFIHEHMQCIFFFFIFYGAWDFIAMDPQTMATGQIWPAKMFKVAHKILLCTG